MLEFLDEIEKHFEDYYPKEGCGVLAVAKGKLKWFPCTNIAEDNEDFIIDSKEYISISQKYDIVGVVHSHPDSTPDPSDMDIKYCNAILYHIMRYLLFF